MPALRAGAWARRNSLSVGDYVPPFLPKNLAPDLWLDAEGITGLSDGAPSSIMPDLSGFSRDHAQPTGGSQPLYYSNPDGVGPALLFDGVDDNMFRNPVGFSLTLPFTVICVARNTQGTDDNVEHSIWDWTGVNEWCFRGMNTTTDKFEFIGPTGMGSVSTPVSSLDTSWRIWFMESRTEVGGCVGSNGALIATGSINPASGLPTGTLTIGSRIAAQRPWKGYIKAVLVWNRLLTPWERYNIHRYYAAKIGVTVTPHVPTDVTGLRFWPRADFLSLSDGASIPTFTDEAGVAWASGGVAPTWWSKATYGSGLPVFRFNGTSQSLIGPTNINLTAHSIMAAAMFETNPVGVHHMLVGKGDAASGMQYSLQIRNGAPGPRAILAYNFDGSSQQDAHGAATVSSQAFHLLALRHGAGATDFYLDRAFDATVSENDGLSNGLPLLIGGKNNVSSNWWPGDFEEMVGYDHKWSDLERLIVEDYFGRRTLI